MQAPSQGAGNVCLRKDALVSSERSGHWGFHGPKCWAVTLLAGLVAGALLALVLPAPQGLVSGVPDVQMYVALPFALLLLSIALMPFINVHFWEHHYPDFAVFLGGVVVSFYLIALDGFSTADGHAHYGRLRMVHVGREYFQFIALIGSLYIVTGGILIDIRGQATPRVNTVLLGVGAVVANLFGTTGAAALLIRPFLRINKHRIRPFHVVLFIFVVANCGGCLTPIGDPPLFLGYLEGVPFTWTLLRCLPAWATCVGVLLAVFYAMDRAAWRRSQPEAAAAAGGEGARVTVRVSGFRNFVFLGVVLFGVFLDKLIEELTGHPVEVPFGAFLQLAAAFAAYRLSRPENLAGNEFSFNPIREVALLFVGIFATMVPALDYLQNNADALGVTTPSAFYWASGSLSSFLDNAPTYYNFLSAAYGLGNSAGPMAAPPLAEAHQWVHLPALGGGYVHAPVLLAISLSSVFFGSNTYIGNGPNFMVKAISEAAGVPMPSFFGYIIKYTLPILLPVLALIWLLYVSGLVF
jgi:Na+/H+ antiporter NhaD/arsenite permease-like protein